MEMMRENSPDSTELKVKYDQFLTQILFVLRLIIGFPTLKVFGSKIIGDAKKGYYKEPTDYNGARTAAAMSEYILSQLPNFVTPVTAKSYDKFLET